MTARAASQRMCIAAALMAVVAGACAKTAPCRPGTVLLPVDFGAFAGQVTRLEAGVAASTPRTRCVRLAAP